MENLWILGRRTQKGELDVCYRLAPSPKELWEAIIEEEMLGTGHTRATLKKQGWTARRVRIDVWE